jgi:hypothetical protein
MTDQALEFIVNARGKTGDSDLFFAAGLQVKPVVVR